MLGQNKKPHGYLVRTAHAHERAALLEIAVRTGLFDAAGADALLGHVLDQAYARALPDGHHVLTSLSEAGAASAGWTYFAPDDHASGVWNVWWIGVDPDAFGGGCGATLLEAAEQTARASGGRLVVVETSATPATARARAFYAKRGYSQRGEIPDFYAEGDAKAIFVKKLA